MFLHVRCFPSQRRRLERSRNGQAEIIYSTTNLRPPWLLTPIKMEETRVLNEFFVDLFALLAVLSAAPSSSTAHAGQTRWKHTSANTHRLHASFIFISVQQWDSCLFPPALTYSPHTAPPHPLPTADLLWTAVAYRRAEGRG